MVVIGTSAGGVSALRSLLTGLPAHFSAPIFIVMHVQPHAISHLPDLINHYCKLPALHPVDGQIIKAGHIYVAPPNVHMLIAKNKIQLTDSPKINYCRPAINPLFESAATHYGSHSIGVLLSGMLNDGTDGLLAIKGHNGITIIQSPDEAEYPEMPQNALNKVAIDYCFTTTEIASLLIDLVN